MSELITERSRTAPAPRIPMPRPPGDWESPNRAVPQRELPQARPSRVGAKNANWRVRYTAVAVAVDFGAGVIASILAASVRFEATIPSATVLAALALPVLWVLLVGLHRTYRHHLIGMGVEESSRVLLAGVTLLAAIALGSYGTKAELSRGFVLLAVGSVVVLSLFGRAAQRMGLRGLRARGHCLQRTLLVGPVPAAIDSLNRLRRDPSHGIAVVGACATTPDGDRALLRRAGVAVFGNLEHIEVVIRQTRAEVVAVLPSAQLTGDELRRLAWRLERTGAQMFVCTGLTEVVGRRLSIRPAGFNTLVAVAPARLTGASRLAKGAFDRCAALLGLALLSPLLVAVAIAVWLGDGGSPLFGQTRVGRDGRPFRIVKFRTMVRDAEQHKAELLADNESGGVLFKIADDPRITPVGRLLRRYSIDELPQLVNVVRGEMSLVGPRPPLPDEADAYEADMRRRLLVKPGMTGLWQVSGRSSLSWADTQMLDIRYVENWSPTLDLLILWRTVRAVLGGSGAH